MTFVLRDPPAPPPQAALFGHTGTTMTGRAKKKQKRASSSSASASATEECDEDDVPAEAFVDRDPDLFAVCLQFMRSNRLPSAVREDLHTLDDLQGEADFFSLEALNEACRAAVEAIKDAKSAAEEKQAEERAELEASEARKSARPIDLAVYSRTPTHVYLKEGEMLFVTRVALTNIGSDPSDNKYRRYGPSELTVLRKYEEVQHLVLQIGEISGDSPPHRCWTLNQPVTPGVMEEGASVSYPVR